ncbi:MAG TPA: DUF4157 domain-containing protein [Pyrinomonadaceae bacterium]|jgi:hypothetical protein
METARVPAKQSASPPAAAAATTRRTSVEPTVVPGAQAAMRQVSGPSVRLGTETTPPAPALPEETAKTVSGTGLGQPLPQDIRQTLEKNFGASLEKVRVHTDTAATRAAQSLSARAFTYGNHIFLGPGEKPTDLALIAHEAAHIVQQRGAPVVQRFMTDQSDAYEAEAQRASAAALRQEPFRVRERTSGFRVQRLGKSDALNFFAGAANAIPGFRMFTIIIGVNPINMAHVEASPGNILRAIIEFVPGGALITEALDKYGIFDKVGNFVAEQIHSLGVTGGVIRQAIMEFLDGLKWSDIFDLEGVWERAKRIFTEPIERIKSFVKGLASGIIKLIKDAVLMPLAALAAETRGWDLLTAILGKNPITDEDVPQDAEALIGGFLKLIQQDEIFQNMKKARALPRAVAWFQSNMGTLLGFVQQIPSLAINAFNALELEDLVLLPRAFKKVAAVFGNFIGDFINWAGKAMWDLLELIFDVVSPGALSYIKKTGAALKSILKNPLPFVGNLVQAAKLGFQNFAANIGQHFKAGLLDWLVGALPGVYIPKAITLPEIVKLVFSVLGLSWANIRAKLVKVIGEPAMKVLETTFDIVVTLVTQGPAAAWEKIKDQLASLKDQIIGGITDLVIDAVKKKAVPKIVAMFIPGAGFISAILSIYDTVMVFVQKLSKIAQVVSAFVNSIVAIAGGNIAGAAKRVESVLAGLLSLAINFLAGFAGLGKIADKVMGIIQKVRATVDKAIDWLINWIVTMAKKLFAKLFGRDKPLDPAEAQNLLDKGMLAAQSAVSRFKGKAVGEAVLRPLLAVIKFRYKLTELNLVVEGKEYSIEAAINPKKKERVVGVKVSDGKFEATIDFAAKPDLDQKEFRYQIRMAQSEMKGMTCEEWLKRREQFFKLKKERAERGFANPEGRDPAAAQRAEYFKDRLLSFLVMQEKKKAPDIPDDKAKAQAQARYDDLTKGKFLTHYLDQVAGGDPTRIRGWRDERVDASIGAAWPSRAKELEAKIKDKVAPEELKNTQLMLTLTVNGSPV